MFQRYRRTAVLTTKRQPSAFVTICMVVNMLVLGGSTLFAPPPPDTQNPNDGAAAAAAPPAQAIEPVEAAEPADNFQQKMHALQARTAELLQKTPGMEEEFAHFMSFWSQETTDAELLQTLGGLLSIPPQTRELEVAQGLQKCWGNTLLLGYILSLPPRERGLPALWQGKIGRVQAALLEVSEKARDALLAQHWQTPDEAVQALRDHWEYLFLHALDTINAEQVQEDARRAAEEAAPRAPAEEAPMARLNIPPPTFMQQLMYDARQDPWGAAIGTTTVVSTAAFCLTGDPRLAVLSTSCVVALFGHSFMRALLEG